MYHIFKHLIISQLKLFNILQRLASFPWLSSCNISQNLAWWFARSDIVHSYNCEKATKNGQKSAKLKFFKISKRQTPFPGPRLLTCNIWQNWAWWFLSSDMVHTYNFEKSIFSNMNMAKYQPNWKFSKFWKYGIHS